MNALTLIGAAAVCKKFSDLLSKDPAKAAQLLGLVLTNLEVNALRAVFGGKNGEELREGLKELNTYFCKKQPCALAPAILDDDFCKDQEAA